MTRIADIRGLGLLPLRHDDYDAPPNGEDAWELELRSAVMACRVKGRNTYRADNPEGDGRWFVGDDDYGDVNCALFWPPADDGSARPIPFAAFAVASRVQDGGDTVLPLFEPDVDDIRMRELAPVFANDRRYPAGTIGVTLATTIESEQREIFLACEQSLVAPHVGGTEDDGTLLYDVEGGRLSEVRNAHAQTLLRVLHSDGKWQWGLQAAEAARGGGGWLNLWGIGDGGQGQSIPAEGDRIGVVCRGSWERLGPFHFGHHWADKHIQGKNVDSENEQPLHLWIDALFYKNKVEDGPLNHTVWRRGAKHQQPTIVQFGFDVVKDKWDWWTTSPIIVPPEPPDFPFKPVPDGNRITSEPDIPWWSQEKEGFINAKGELINPNERPVQPNLSERELAAPSFQLTSSREPTTQPGDGRFGGRGCDTEFEKSPAQTGNFIGKNILDALYPTSPHDAPDAMPDFQQVGLVLDDDGNIVRDRDGEPLKGKAALDEANRRRQEKWRAAEKERARERAERREKQQAILDRIKKGQDEKANRDAERKAKREAAEKARRDRIAEGQKRVADRNAERKRRQEALAEHFRQQAKARQQRNEDRKNERERKEAEGRERRKTKKETPPGSPSWFNGASEMAREAWRREQAGIRHQYRSGRAGYLSPQAKERGGPAPFTTHMSGLASVNSYGEWEYASEPGTHWGNGTALAAAAMIAPGGWLPDGPTDQSSWLGDLTVLLYAGTQGGNPVDFGWGDWSQLDADWSNGVVHSLVGDSGKRNVQTDYRNAAGAARNGYHKFGGVLVGNTTGAMVGLGKHADNQITDAGTTDLTVQTSAQVQFFAVKANGAGGYTRNIDLLTTDDEGNAVPEGAFFNINLNVGIDGGTDTSTVVIRNGSGGSTLATITSSPSGATLRDIVAYFDGTNWRLKSHHTTLTVGLAIA